MRSNAFETNPERGEQKGRNLLTLSTELQPDQQPRHWDAHVETYERVFEPLTNALAREALDALCLSPGLRLLDVGAGAGGAALLAAGRGARVTAVDASPGMVRRIETRARDEGVAVDARTMDGAALAFPDRSFDAALSVFGIILFPDPVGAMRELARVLVPGGGVALVTWTEPHRYELAGRLIAAIAAVGQPLPASASLPAQLRFREEPEFRALFAAAGFEEVRVRRIETTLRALSAGWLGERLAFAPGLSTMLAAQGDRREAVERRFVADLERDKGMGEIALEAVAFFGLATAPRTGLDRLAQGQSAVGV